MTSKVVLKVGGTTFSLINVPWPIYKFFTVADYADAFVSRGTVRIGTLHDFRRVEAHDDARGDASEGLFDYVHRSAFPEDITLENASAPLRHFIQQTGQPIASRGGTITAHGSHPDCYVYCASASPNPGTGSYGTHGVRIDDPIGFFRELTRHLAKHRRLIKSSRGFAAPCLYRERQAVSRSVGEFREAPMAHIKPPERAPDREVRAIWYPATDAIEPFVSRCGALRPFLSAL